jgi:predicted DNA repair protein MutK
MSGGLLALLDDVAAIAKVAAASLDDVAAQTAKAGAKAAGIVIDDAAVTPRYVVGFAAEREIPIVARIAWGSVRNKLFLLLPAALALNAVAPWAITPLLLVGALYLCFEGFEKLHEMVAPAHGATEDHAPAAADPAALEDSKVAGAIRTDMILSAEIMAITLSTVADKPFVTQAIVLALVGLGITVAVYGVVALIVKADDFGVALAARGGPVSRAVGRGIVQAMPHLLKLLSIVGTLAMLWVGGGIVLHSLAVYGLAGPEHAVEAAGQSVASLLPAMGGAVSWLTAATLSGLLGVILGFLVERAVIVWRSVRRSKPAL